MLFTKLFRKYPCRISIRLSSLQRTTPFKLADIGEGIAEVELMQWFIKVRNLYCIYSDVSVSSIIFCMDDYIMDVTGRR